MSAISAHARARHHIARNFDAGEHLELFFVSAVTSILLIRLYLEVTGYPQLGYGGIHVAHVLWGGFFMLLAILIRIIFMGPTVETWSALAGGIGFGTFIDEIGKFITRDNDYFYKPSVALIYITFILMILLIRLVRLRRRYTRSEYMVNALRTTEFLYLRGGGPDEHGRALDYLDSADRSDPLVRGLRAAIIEFEARHVPGPTSYNRLKTYLRNAYVRIVNLPGFVHLVTAIFSLQLAVMALHLFVIVFLKGLKVETLLRIHPIEKILENINGFGFIEWTELGVAFIAALFIIAGMIELKHSRYRAYVLFERSVLVNIFITQVLLFYQDRFGALAGMFVNLLLLLALRHMIGYEQKNIVNADT